MIAVGTVNVLVLFGFGCMHGAALCEVENFVRFGHGNLNLEGQEFLQMLIDLLQECGIQSIQYQMSAYRVQDP